MVEKRDSSSDVMGLCLSDRRSLRWKIVRSIVQLGILLDFGGGYNSGYRWVGW